MPVFTYGAINDQIVSIGATDDHIDRICGVGANVLYQRNTIGAHPEEETGGNPRAFNWLELVLDGRRPEPTLGCRVETVTVGT